MNKRLLLLLALAPIGISGTALAQPFAGANSPTPAYVYYEVPCDTPGAIVTGSAYATPGAGPDGGTPNWESTPPICIAAVATGPQAAGRRYYRGRRYAYDSLYWPGYYPRPYFGVGLFGGGHHGGHRGGHHDGGGHGGGHGGHGGGGHHGGGHGRH